jgi:SAM-dependent methyltransferase
MGPAEMWQLGDYARVGDRWAEAGQRLVQRVVRPGDRVLDVATGPGVVAIAAARAGASPTGLDAAPSLLAQARARAAAAGLDVRWVEADMTAIPEPDAAYDTVLSAFGAMFAPDPYAMAAELVRVCGPGGLVGVLAWTPESPFGRQADIVFRYLPPEAGQGRPPIEAWGQPAKVRDFFAGQPVDVTTTMDTVDVRWASLDEAVDEITTLVPGWVAARAPIEATGGWPRARADVAEVFASAGRTDPDGFVLPVQYQTTLARRH